MKSVYGPTWDILPDLSAFSMLFFCKFLHDAAIRTEAHAVEEVA